MKNFTNNFKQFTSRLSARWLIMALMMLVGTSSAWAATRTYNGTEKLYIQKGSWWFNDNVYVAAYFFNDSTGKNQWTNAVKSSSSATYVEVTVPKGTWQEVIVVRLKGSVAEWNCYNQTADIPIDATNNCIKPESNEWGTKKCDATITKFTVTGSQTTVTLSGSESGVTYDLLKDGTSVSSTKEGTASSLSWTVSNSGVYTVRATITGCSTYTTMSGSYSYSSCTTCCTDYYVAGVPDLCDESWDASADKMSCNDNIWSITFIDRAADEYEFKITNGSWNTDSDKDNEWSTFDNSKGNITCSGGNGSNIQFTTTSKGDITISFDGTNAWVTFTKSCTSATYSISFADDATTVNKGATLQASVTSSGTDYGAISWESSDPSIATISSTGEITGKKGGLANITATIADGDTYCGGTVTKDIIIKETPTITITGDSYGCNENKTLTATVTGLETGTSYTIKWYKEDVDTEAISTGSMYTATESGTYVAQVTGTYINDTSEEFVFTKYDATPIPEISLASSSICASSTTTLTINDYDAINYSYKLYNGENEVENPVFATGVYTLSEAGTYYVTATPTSGDCQVESSKQTTGLTLTVTSVTLSLDPTSAPICSGATIADIDDYVTAKATVLPSGTANISWYDSETATTALTDNVTLTATTYYAEATTESGCKSERQAFKVTSLMTVPSVPVITPSADAICSGNSVTLTLTDKVDGETYKIGEDVVFTDGNTYTISSLDTTTDYIVTATNSCGSTESAELTINVTTTPVISGPSATQPDKEITLSSAAGASTNWMTTGGTLTPETGTETVFTTTSNGNYTITAKNTDNNITCSATHEIVVNDKFYIYIRRPKSGDAIYSDWYGKTNDAEKGGAAWFKTGEPNYENLSETNYDGYGPLTNFEDCNGYIWDGYQGITGNFYIHAPNTGGQDGYATFTQAVNVTSLATDRYYIISSWTSGTKGAILTEQIGNNIPTRLPEVTVPVLSVNPVSGIICQGAEATITVTNPENGVTYTLNYAGTDQEETIPYTGTETVAFNVGEAGKYLVKAETTSGECKGNASSATKEIKVLTTSISFTQQEYTTTPWVPVTVIIEAPDGYDFTYNDAILTALPEENRPIKKEESNEYTYTFPRPSDWGVGNSASGNGYDAKEYSISATIKNAEQCGSAQAKIILEDEGNDNCTTNQ